MHSSTNLATNNQEMKEKNSKSSLTADESKDQKEEKKGQDRLVLKKL